MLKLKLSLMVLCATMAFGCALQSNNGSVEASGKDANGSMATTVEKTSDDSKPKTSANVKTSIVEGTLFRGSLSDKPIEMRLKRDGNKLSGTYNYTKIGKNLTLRGTIDAKDKFELQEFDDANKQTGVFKGDWKTDPNESGITLEGHWRKPNAPEKDDDLYFGLNEQMIEFKGDAKIVTRNINNDLKAKRLELGAEYPEITGGNASGVNGFNQTAKTLAQKDLDSFKKDTLENQKDVDLKDMPADNYLSINYDVELANDDLISVTFNEDSYSGGAHGSHDIVTLNYDLAKNKKLALGDLFKPNSDYLKTISQYCIAELEKPEKENPDFQPDKEWIERGAGAEADNFKSWNITKKGLLISFPQYQVASYAEGPKYIIVPYSKLKSIVNPSGALANLAN